MPTWSTSILCLSTEQGGHTEEPVVIVIPFLVCLSVRLLFMRMPRALSIEHRMIHVPKNRLCDVCNRAKLYSSRVRSHRVADPEEDLEEPGKVR